MEAKNYLKHWKRFLFKNGGLPIYVVLFVTENCTAKCFHCLLGEKKRATNELTIDEIEKLSKNMGNILFLLLTGGEPFLRDDLPDIAKIFYKNNSVCNLGIPSNGSLTTKVVESAEKILKQCRNIDFAIDISIDAIGEEHDKVRGTEGLFEKAVWTYRELSKLGKKYDNFTLNIALTASSFNQDKLVEIYHYLKDKLGARSITYLLTRGSPRVPSAKKVDIENYIKLGEILEKDTMNSNLIGYENYFGSDLLNAMKILRQKTVSKIVKENKKVLPCYAASLSCVITSKGDVYPCELLSQKMGNLRDENYDFKKIWESKEAKDIRKHIKETGCFCTYECFLTNSIIFTPSMFPKVIKEWYKIKKAKSGFGNDKNLHH